MRRRQRDLRIKPADGSVVQVITGSPWSDTSQRGVAYDPAADVILHRGGRRIVLPRRRSFAPDPGRDTQPVQPGRPEHLRACLELLVQPSLGGDEQRHRHDLPDRPATVVRPSVRFRIRTVAGSAGPGSKPTPSATCGPSARTAATPTSSRSGLPTFSDVFVAVGQPD